MSATTSADDRKRGFAHWVSVKRNFLLAATIAFGLGPGSFFAWWLSSIKGVPLGLILCSSALWFGAGYIWGVIMWRFFEFKRQQWRAALDKSDDV